MHGGNARGTDLAGLHCHCGSSSPTQLRPSTADEAIEGGGKPMIWVLLGGIVTWLLVGVMGAPWWFALTTCLAVGLVLAIFAMKSGPAHIEEES